MSDTRSEPARRRALLLRTAAPHAACIFAFAFLYRSFVLAAVLGAGLGVALVYFRERKPTFIWQFIYALGGAAGAYAISRLFDPRVQVELAALFFGAAAARLPLFQPMLKGRLDFVLLSFVIVALGASREPAHAAYIASAVLFVLALTASAGDASPLRLFRDHPIATASIVALSIVLAIGLGWTTKRLSGVTPLLGGEGGNGRTGFSGQVRLGDSSGLETSDVVVMRIRGGHTDYLRGAVQTSFDRDAWLNQRTAVKLLGSERGPITVSMAKPTRFLFAPLGGAGVTDGAFVDIYGVTTVAVAISEFSINPNAEATIVRPQAKDTAVPPRMLAPIKTLAEQIVGSEKNDRARVALLSQFLKSNYRYSLSRSRSSRDTPALLDFLFADKEGHCEYFASALAMLARSLDIPARVVSGYRVVESNRFGSYDVVRERNAHAWVEVWDSSSSAWRTEDPTPATEAMDPRSDESLFAFVDAAREQAAALGQALASRPALLLFILALAATALIARRFWSQFRDKRARFSGESSQRLFAELSALYEERGLRREPWEGIEAYAARVHEAGEAEAARMFVRYAEVRYDPTATSEEASLATEIEELLARVRALRAPRTGART